MKKFLQKNYFVIFKDEAKSEKINVQYLQNDKEISFVLKMEETLIDYFLETYENFLNAFLEENK